MGWAPWDHLSDLRVLEHNGRILGAVGGSLDRQAGCVSDFPSAGQTRDTAGVIDSGTLETESSVAGCKRFGNMHCWVSWA